MYIQFSPFLTIFVNEPRPEKNPSSGLPTRSDTNWAFRPQKMARCLKYWIKGEEELYYLLY